MLEGTHKEILVNKQDGVVHGTASVGDVYTSIRLRRSNSAFQPIRLSTKSARGSNITDGLYPFAHRYSSVARVYEMYSPIRKLGSYIYKNIENEDRITEPKMQPGGRATFWRKAQEVLSTAPKSLVSLGVGYGPASGDLLRGAQYPERRIISSAPLTSRVGANSGYPTGNATQGVWT